MDELKGERKKNKRKRRRRKRGREKKKGKKIIKRRWIRKEHKVRPL